MTTLLEAFEKLNLEEEKSEEKEHEVIHNSDTLYKQDIEWVKDIPYVEPSEYEKNLIKHTLTPEKLIEEEKKEVNIKTQEEIDKEYKEAYILRVKVIAMHNLGKSIISNPSYWKHELKKKLIDEMQNILDGFNEQELIEKFNIIVNETLLDTNFKYDTFPLKRT
jgi:hypothetical protein